MEFGLILLAMVLLLFGAGFAIQLRAERRPLAEPTRAPDRHRRDRRRRRDAADRARRARVQRSRHRRHGLRPLARPHEADAATPQNEPGPPDRDRERPLDLLEPGDRRLGEPRVAGAGRRRRSPRRSCASATSRRRASTLTATCCRRSPTSASSALRSAWSRSWPGSSLSRATLGCGAARRERAMVRERIGLRALALVAVVFGVHSALDWTWFVPAVAMTGLFCRRLGRRPRAARGGRDGGPAPGPAARGCAPSLPTRPGSTGAAAVALGISPSRALAALAVAQPWRAEQKGNDALGSPRRATSPPPARPPRRQGHQPAVGRSVLRAGRDRGRGRRRPPAAVGARARRPARAGEPGGVAAARRLLPNLLRPGRAIPVLKARSSSTRVSTAGRSGVPARAAGGAGCRWPRPRPAAEGRPRSAPRRGAAAPARASSVSRRAAARPRAVTRPARSRSRAAAGRASGGVEAETGSSGSWWRSKERKRDQRRS